MRGFVVMGVSGCGKTTLGNALAKGGAISFVDGDDLHPASNIAKMAAGTPLNDEDRAPWLADVGRTLGQSKGAIAIGCSALKRSYRDIIRSTAKTPVYFLHLTGSYDVLSGRMKSRAGHFMPTTLLDSQLATLEPLQPEEDGHSFDIDAPLEVLVNQVQAHIRSL